MLFRRKYVSAFTIVELLLAAAITVVIVVLLGTMFGSLTTAASRANRRTDAFREARAALQMIERDLTGLAKVQQTAYFVLDKRWQPGSTDPPDAYADQTSSTPNRQLYALILANNQPPGKTANEVGDLCAVGYYCRWEGDTVNGYHYALRRFFRHSIDTFNAIKPQFVGGNLAYTSASLLYSPSATDDLLASYVWNLQITPYKADGTLDTTYPLVVDPSTPAVIVPAALAISFLAISPTAARTAASISSDPADWMDSTKTNYQRLIQPYAYEFRTRVKL